LHKIVIVVLLKYVVRSQFITTSLNKNYFYSLSYKILGFFGASCPIYVTQTSFFTTTATLMQGNYFIVSRTI